MPVDPKFTSLQFQAKAQPSRSIHPLDSKRPFFVFINQNHNFKNPFVSEMFAW